MPWSNGVYTRTNGQFGGSSIWDSDKANGIKIESARHDVHDQDMATGITACLNKNGQNAMAAALNMGLNKVVNMAPATNASDGVSLTQLSTYQLQADSITGMVWNGDDLRATRANGNFTVPIRVINDFKSGGKIKHRSEVMAVTAQQTAVFNTTTATRFTLVCNSNVTVTITRPTGADADLNENYCVEGSLVVTNGTSPGTITLSGVNPLYVLGAQNLQPNERYVLSYIIHRAANNVYTEIYSWAT